ncbi:GAF domain-containing protein [Kitasatospora sp. NPDC058965]|uniref:GAF domain-containing protein n=1 Tax=Kitasatospora sp. NPDC058965 TaxID=3346682 RepID=UPI0036BC7580
MPHDQPTRSRAAAGPDRGDADPAAAELLRSVVEVARAIFGAQASSVFLLDEEAGELVFQAVSGRGEEFLVGRRFPAGSGIAGWVAGTGEPMVVDDLSQHAAFDRSLARSTEYVPDALMAAPLVHGDRVLGVLEVLDPAPQARASLPELELLALFARLAAAALRIATDRRPADGGTGLAPEHRARAVRLVGELAELLHGTA